MKNPLNYFLLFPLIFVIILGCGKEDLDINTLEDFEEYIAGEMKYQKIPAMSVLIFKGDNILYEKYLGKSNIEQNIALENNHMFLLASISKVITANALLQLNEDGLFDLDDNINDYLPFEVNVPGYTQNITFRMLLTHTSAIADNYDVLDQHYFYGQDSPISLKTFMERYLIPGGIHYNTNKNFYNFRPGTEHEYSNVGSALIALLVEEISGTDFNIFCKENIFIPLGMQNTVWRLDEINQTIVTPYDYFGGQNNAIQNYTNTDFPNGGLRSTTLDLHKFLRAYMNGGQYNNYQLLNQSTINQILTKQIPSIDDEVGLHIFVVDGLWGHDGGEQGVATSMAFNPTNKVGAIILTNKGEADLEEILSEAYKIGLKL